MGEPVWLKASRQERSWRVRRELKHLSTCRKRKKVIDSQSSGDRNGKSPNRAPYGVCGVVGASKGNINRTGTVLERRTAEGESPVRVRLMFRDAT